MTVLSRPTADAGFGDTDGGVFAGSLFMLESAVVDRHHGDREGLGARHTLAVAYLRAGRVAESLPLFEAVLADTRRLLGPRDPDTLVTEGNLAAAYLTVGRDVAGLETMIRNAGLRTEVLGPDHPATLTAADALAAALRLADRPRDAIARHADTAARRTRVLGPGHPDTLTSRAGLALARADDGDVRGAADLLNDVVADTDRWLGRPHPVGVTVRGIRAECLAFLERTAAAREEFGRAAADAELLWGADGGETVRLREEIDALSER